MASLQAFLSFVPRAPKFPLPIPLLTPATQATDAQRDVWDSNAVAYNSVPVSQDLGKDHIFDFLEKQRKSETSARRVNFGEILLKTTEKS